MPMLNGFIQIGFTTHRRLVTLHAYTATITFPQFLAFVCSTWLVISWAIALTLLPKHNQISDVIFFYCVAPVLTVPLPLMIFYDLPKRFPTIYQCFLLVSIWSWS